MMQCSDSQFLLRGPLVVRVISSSGPPITTQINVQFQIEINFNVSADPYYEAARVYQKSLGTTDIVDKINAVCVINLKKLNIYFATFLSREKTAKKVECLG